jgi:hypothetical protein
MMAEIDIYAGLDDKPKVADKTTEIEQAEQELVNIQKEILQMRQDLEFDSDWRDPDTATQTQEKLIPKIEIEREKIEPKKTNGPQEVYKKLLQEDQEQRLRKMEAEKKPEPVETPRKRSVPREPAPRRAPRRPSFRTAHRRPRDPSPKRQRVSPRTGVLLVSAETLAMESQVMDALTKLRFPVYSTSRRFEAATDAILDSKQNEKFTKFLEEQTCRYFSKFTVTQFARWMDRQRDSQVLVFGVTNADDIDQFKQKYNVVSVLFGDRDSIQGSNNDYFLEFSQRNPHRMGDDLKRLLSKLR